MSLKSTAMTCKIGTYPSINNYFISFFMLPAIHLQGSMADHGAKVLHDLSQDL